MEFIHFKELCAQIFAFNPSIPQPNNEQVEQLFALTEYMLEVNKSMNLTAIKQEDAIILKHYVDSLTISKYIYQGATLIDVGCGAGFPTLPLAIFRPDINITAIDGTAKRIEYIKKAAKKLNLNNVSAIAARAEELGNDTSYRQCFDYVTARAVAALPILSELCLPLVKVGGKFIAMKAQKGDDELSFAKNAITKCGGIVVENVKEDLLGIDNNIETRSIIIVSKSSSTPKEYPRHYSKISKKPL